MDFCTRFTAEDLLKGSDVSLSKQTVSSPVYVPKNDDDDNIKKQPRTNDKQPKCGRPATKKTKSTHQSDDESVPSQTNTSAKKSKSKATSHDDDTEQQRADMDNTEEDENKQPQTKQSNRAKPMTAPKEKITTTEQDKMQKQLSKSKTDREDDGKDRQENFDLEAGLPILLPQEETLQSRKRTTKDTNDREQNQPTRKRASKSDAVPKCAPKPTQQQHTLRKQTPNDVVEDAVPSRQTRKKTQKEGEEQSQDDDEELVHQPPPIRVRKDTDNTKEQHRNQSHKRALNENTDDDDDNDPSQVSQPPKHDNVQSDAVSQKQPPTKEDDDDDTEEPKKNKQPLEQSDDDVKEPIQARPRKQTSAKKVEEVIPKKQQPRKRAPKEHVETKESDQQYDVVEPKQPRKRVPKPDAGDLTNDEHPQSIKQPRKRTPTVDADSKNHDENSDIESEDAVSQGAHENDETLRQQDTVRPPQKIEQRKRDSNTNDAVGKQTVGKRAPKTNTTPRIVPSHFGPDLVDILSDLTTVNVELSKAVKLLPTPREIRAQSITNLRKYIENVETIATHASP